MWWHIFTFANGYTLYWLCYSFCLYVEKYDGYDAPGAPIKFGKTLIDGPES